MDWIRYNGWDHASFELWTRYEMGMILDCEELKVYMGQEYGRNLVYSMVGRVQPLTRDIKKTFHIIARGEARRENRPALLSINYARCRSRWSYLERSILRRVCYEPSPIKYEDRVKRRQGYRIQRCLSTKVYTVSIYRFISLCLVSNIHQARVGWAYQSVTASSNSRTSFSRVPPKWSTNSSPKTSRATLSLRMNRAVASFRLLARRSPLSLMPPTS